MIVQVNNRISQDFDFFKWKNTMAYQSNKLKMVVFLISGGKWWNPLSLRMIQKTYFPINNNKKHCTFSIRKTSLRITTLLPPHTRKGSQLRGAVLSHLRPWWNGQIMTWPEMKFWFFQRNQVHILHYIYPKKWEEDFPLSITWSCWSCNFQSRNSTQSNPNPHPIWSHRFCCKRPKQKSSGNSTKFYPSPRPISARHGISFYQWMESTTASLP